MEEQLICTRCGTFIPDRHHLTWADDGKHLCYPCRGRLDEANRKRHEIVTGREEIYVALVLTTFGVAGALLIGWAMIFAVATWVQARRRFSKALADPEVRAALGPHRVVITLWLGASAIVGGAIIVFFLVSLAPLAARLR